MMTLLKLIHIFSAIFWMGSTLFLGLILEPAIHSAGPAGKKFMQHLVQGPLHYAMALTGLTTITTGLWMYALLSGGNFGTMLGYRLPLTLGALAGLTALIFGIFFQGRTTRALMVLSAQLDVQDTPPSTEQIQQIAALQRRLEWGGRLNILLMSLAVIGMVL